MKPILFAENETVFTTNGLGRLDCTECIVTEERNGVYQLELSIAESALHADQIAMNSIIAAIPSDGGNLQAFRVYKINKPVNGIFKVVAQHISYQLSLIPTMPFSILASNHACQDTLTALKSNAVVTCPFTFHTDVTTIAPYKQDLPASIRSRLGGVSGSVLDQFGGEYLWDNYDIYLKAHRGVQTPQVTLLYGKNITDLEQEENIANTITGIVPYWTNGDTTVTLPEKVIETSHATSFPFKRIVTYDFSSSFDEQPTEAQLRAKAQAYVNKDGVGVPVVSIKVSFLQLSDTEEFKDLAPLQHVKLCDRINVYFAKYDIQVTAKVVKTVYDVLAERYNSIEVGSIRSNLATTITDAQNQTTQEIENKFAQVSGEVQEAVDTATAWLTAGNGYVMAVKNNDGSWKELLFLDTDDAATAHNVLRINQNGIGFSSTGVSGPFTQAWTLDGRIVIGGTNTPSLTVYDNQQNILFQINSSGMQWNATNSSMTTDGTLTAKNASLQGSLITRSQIPHTNNYSVVEVTGGSLDFKVQSYSAGEYQDLNDAFIRFALETYESGSYESLVVHSDDFITLENDHSSGISIGPYFYNQNQYERVRIDVGMGWLTEAGNYCHLEMIDGQGIEMTHGHATQTQWGWYEIREAQLILKEEEIRLNCWGNLYISGYDSVNIDSGNGDVIVQGKSLTPVYYYNDGAITDFDVDYDYDTGYVNNIYNISHSNYWTF